MRWKLAKKLMSRKTLKLESHKYIKQFQAKKYSKIMNLSLREVEDHCWKIWFPHINYFKYGCED